MKKQLLLFVLILLSLTSNAAIEIDGIYYLFNTTEKTATVTYLYNNDDNSSAYSGTVSIPNEVVYNDVTYRVTSIGESAFHYCYNLTSISIPNSVTSIGSNAFNFCRNITSLTIPKSVTYITMGAFINCRGLATIVVETGNTKYDSRNDCNAIINTSTNELIVGCKNTIIPNSVTSIGNYAFWGSELTSIIIPGNVTVIDEGAFGFNNFMSITIPNSVTSIGKKAFMSCDNLSSVTIPNSVTSIGEEAFHWCNGLTSITIGCGVTSIDYRAFSLCKSLKDVYCLAENAPKTNSDAFEYSMDNATLYVPTGRKSAYETANCWRAFKEIVEIVPEKCATPTITIKDGLLDFNCETEGVTFKFSYRIGEANETSEGNQLKLAGRTIAHVSVCATKEGYLDSDAVTADVELQIGKKGDVNQDGIVSISDAVSIVNLILESGSE